MYPQEFLISYERSNTQFLLKASDSKITSTNLEGFATAFSINQGDRNDSYLVSGDKHLSQEGERLSMRGYKKPLEISIEDCGMSVMIKDVLSGNYLVVSPTGELAISQSGEGTPFSFKNVPAGLKQQEAQFVIEKRNKRNARIAIAVLVVLAFLSLFLFM